MVSLRGLFIAEWSRGVLQNARIMVALLICAIRRTGGCLKNGPTFHPQGANFSSLLDIFHFPIRDFYYKVCNACYKACNTYYKVCNTY